MTSAVTVGVVGRNRLVAQLRDEVRALDDQLRRAQRLVTVGTITSMIVHEINNILTHVIGRLDLADEGDETSCRSSLRRARKGYDSAAAICQALLHLTCDDPQQVQTIPVAQLVEETLAAMARAPSKDGIVLIRKVSPKFQITTRPVELKQVLLNLLLNARTAVLKKGGGQSISISASRRNGETFIRVADTGVGIPPENRQRIFEPFFTTRNGDGTGLGLAVCREIVQSLKGRISVRSQPGKNTCFTIALPSDGPDAKRR